MSITIVAPAAWGGQREWGGGDTCGVSAAPCGFTDPPGCP